MAATKSVKKMAVKKPGAGAILSTSAELIAVAKSRQKGKAAEQAVAPIHVADEAAALNLYIATVVAEHFDADFYLGSNEDVRQMGVDPLNHYLNVGWTEGRNPCPTFDTAYYLSENPDVKEASVQPFYHYVAHGKAEGRLGQKPELQASHERQSIERALRILRETTSSTPSERLAVLLRNLPRSAEHCATAKANLEIAATSSQFRLALVVGWVMYERDASVWIESSTGGIQLLQGLYQYHRDDVVKAVGGGFTYPNMRAGFLASLPQIEPDSIIAIKALTEKGVHVLSEIKVEKLPSGPTAVAQLLASIDCPIEELQKRVSLVDKTILQPYIQARAESWVHLSVSQVQHGPVNEKPTVSIVVPLYGRFDFIEHQLLEFSKDAWLREHAEIIYVVDDPAIVDRMRSECQHLYAIHRFPFKWVFGEANRGFSGANNLGVSVSKGQYLVFLNSDAFPRKAGWCESLIAVLKSRPDIGAVGPRLLSADGSIQHGGMELLYRPDLGIWVNHHPRMGLDPSLDPFRELTIVQGVTGACFAMRRREFDLVEGWDCGYLIGDFEDSDLCFKLRSAGYEVAYLPNVELTHLERQSFKLLGKSDFRTRVVIFNAVRHQERWAAMLPGASQIKTAGHVS